MTGTVRALALAGVLGLALITPSGPAQAAAGAVAETDDGAHAIYYVAGPNQANNVVVTFAWGDEGTYETWFTIDDVVPITPGQGCSRPDEDDPTVVRCLLHELGDFWVFLDMRVGDQADRVNLFATGGRTPPGDLFLYAGSGDDVVTSAGNLTVRGGDGNDTVTGAFQSYGEAGSDTLAGSAHAHGGDGHDTITAKNAGSQIQGGTGNDTVQGGTGRDTIYGNSGNDLVRGGPGNDRLYGGPGIDTVYGNSGDDRLEGGPGTDRLSGGPGRNVVIQ